MFRKLLMGTSAVFAIWTGLDFFFHGVILGEYYQETALLWRPKGEEKMILNSIVVLVSSFIFTLIYTVLVNPKSTRIGFIYGTMFGTAFGASMGYGSYAFMPVPSFMGLIWTMAGIVEGMAGGAVVGWLITNEFADEPPITD